MIFLPLYSNPYQALLNIKVTTPTGEFDVSSFAKNCGFAPWADHTTIGTIKFEETVNAVSIQVVSLFGESRIRVIRHPKQKSAMFCEHLQNPGIFREWENIIAIHPVKFLTPMAIDFKEVHASLNPIGFVEYDDINAIILDVFGITGSNLPVSKILVSDPIRHDRFVSLYIIDKSDFLNQQEVVYDKGQQIVQIKNLKNGDIKEFTYDRVTKSEFSVLRPSENTQTSVFETNASYFVRNRSSKGAHYVVGYDVLFSNNFYVRAYNDRKQLAYKKGEFIGDGLNQIQSLQCHVGSDIYETNGSGVRVECTRGNSSEMMYLKSKSKFFSDDIYMKAKTSKSSQEIKPVKFLVPRTSKKTVVHLELSNHEKKRAYLFRGIDVDQNGIFCKRRTAQFMNDYLSPSSGMLVLLSAQMMNIDELQGTWRELRYSYDRVNKQMKLSDFNTKELIAKCEANDFLSRTFHLSKSGLGLITDNLATNLDEYKIENHQFTLKSGGVASLATELSQFDAEFEKLMPGVKVFDRSNIMGNALTSFLNDAYAEELTERY